MYDSILIGILYMCHKQNIAINTARMAD